MEHSNEAPSSKNEYTDLEILKESANILRQFSQPIFNKISDNTGQGSGLFIDAGR